MQLQAMKEVTPDYVGIDDVCAVEGHLTREEVKKLRVGRKLLVSGYVDFGYPVPGERRGVIQDLRVGPREVYFVGYQWRREGMGEAAGSSRDWFTGEVDTWGGFSGTRNVLVLCVKANNYGSDCSECLPEQAVLKTKKGRR